LKNILIIALFIVSIQAKFINGYEINSRTNLNNANLSESELMGRDISYSHVKYAIFSDAILMGTKFNYSNLNWSIFDNAYLVKASLVGADLSHVRFDGADLRGANLSKSVIVGTNFKNANLEDAIWTNGKKCQKGSIGRCVQLSTPIIADYEENYTIKKAKKLPDILLPYEDDFVDIKTPEVK